MKATTDMTWVNPLPPFSENELIENELLLEACIRLYRNKGKSTAAFWLN